MKSELKLKEVEKEKEFPKMMKWKDSELIVLFTKYGEGVVVNVSGMDYIGDYADDWVMESFIELPKDSQVILTA